MWPIIADLYTPLLLVLVIWGLKKSAKRNEIKTEITALFLGAAVLYLAMFIDSYFLLFHQVGLDYSTHSGAALLLVVYLCRQDKVTALLSCFSLLGYYLLMWWLNYHSFADMLTTTALLLPCYLLFYKFNDWRS